MGSVLARDHDWAGFDRLSMPPVLRSDTEPAPAWGSLENFDWRGGLPALDVEAFFLRSDVPANRDEVSVRPRGTFTCSA